MDPRGPGAAPPHPECDGLRRLGHMRPFPLLLPLVLFLTATAPPAAAHEYWLSLDRWIAPAGQGVALSAFSGMGFQGERKPYAPDRVVRFLARTGILLDLRGTAARGETTWTRFAPSDDGGTMFAYQSDFVPITLPAAEFDAYLAVDGLDAPLASRRAGNVRIDGRERYRRCAKAWLAGNEPGRATRPIGMPLEIVPLTVPGADAQLEVVVLSEGRPLVNALVNAWRAPPGFSSGASDSGARDLSAVVAQVRTDRRGRATFRVAAAGEWLLSTVHMVPCRATAEADWESTWASLTFGRR